MRGETGGERDGVWLWECIARQCVYETPTKSSRPRHTTSRDHLACEFVSEANCLEILLFHSHQYDHPLFCISPLFQRSIGSSECVVHMDDYLAPIHLSIVDKKIGLMSAQTRRYVDSCWTAKQVFKVDNSTSKSQFRHRSAPRPQPPLLVL